MNEIYKEMALVIHPGAPVGYTIQFVFSLPAVPDDGSHRPQATCIPHTGPGTGCLALSFFWQPSTAQILTTSLTPCLLFCPSVLHLTKSLARKRQEQQEDPCQGRPPTVLGLS